MNSYRIKALFLHMLFLSNFIVPQEVFHLSRVVLPTYEQVKTEKTAMSQRAWRRGFIKYGSIIAVMAAMVATFKASEYFTDQEQFNRIRDQRLDHVEKTLEFKWKDWFKGFYNVQGQSVEPVVENSGNTLLAPLWWVTGGIKAFGSGTTNFFKDLMKCIITTSPTFITGMVLTGAWQNASEQITEATTVESIAWYIQKHTKLWVLFADIKTACVPFDLHSELLGPHVLHGQASTHIKSFIKDIAQVVKNHKQGEMFDDAFLEFQCDDLQKKYAKKGAEIETLQDYAVPATAKRKRAELQGMQDVDLFGARKIGKKDLAELCNIFAQEVQKVVAFTQVHLNNRSDKITVASFNRGRRKVEQIIELANNYLEKMQELLNASSEQLDSLSKDNKGMFTCTYEFEKLFREYAHNVHRYCAMID